VAPRIAKKTNPYSTPRSGGVPLGASLSDTAKTCHERTCSAPPRIIGPATTATGGRPNDSPFIRLDVERQGAFATSDFFRSVSLSARKYM